jgi:hypothetical protein
VFCSVGYLQFCRERDESVVGEKIDARDFNSSRRLCLNQSDDFELEEIHNSINVIWQIELCL